MKRAINRIAVKRAENDTYRHEGAHADDLQHPRVEDYAGSVSYGLAHELIEYLGSPEGQASLKAVMATNCKVVANLALTDEVKEASRVGAMMAVKGSYDALEGTSVKAWNAVPKIVKVTLVSAILCYVSIFSMLLLMAVGRFALFGLH